MLAQRANEQIAAAFAEAEAILSGPTIQARCMECAALSPPPFDVRRASLFELLKAWLTA